MCGCGTVTLTVEGVGLIVRDFNRVGWNLELENGNAKGVRIHETVLFLFLFFSKQLS